MQRKLHLGCGPVYLKGYMNIDIKGEWAEDRPDLVKENSTTVEHYFKWDYVKQPIGHNKRKDIVVDLKANVKDLPVADSVADEILTVNVVDHMKYADFMKALKEWKRVLKKGGRLIIDVGDINKAAEMLLEAKTWEDYEWALRLIYCHSRDKYDSHHWGYTQDYLTKILQENGFRSVWARTDYIKHVYPAFQLCVEKL